jgi:hypothetical protein
MPTIFVATDNSDRKRFNGLKAGALAVKAEEKMQKAVTRVVDAASDFTTKKTDDAKGYEIRLKVVTVDKSGVNVKCGLSGDIVRYPPSPSAKEGDRSEIVTLGWTGNGFASGKSDGAVLDCIEAIAEDMAGKALPKMRLDFAKR